LSGTALSGLFCDMYLVPDGLQVGEYFRICDTLERIWLDHDRGRLVVHDWGTGDYDCLVCNDRAFPLGSIAFIGHDPPATIQVTRSFADWILGLCMEHLLYGDIMHLLGVTGATNRLCAYRQVME